MKSKKIGKCFADSDFIYTFAPANKKERSLVR
jgi:hypothetical protein